MSEHDKERAARRQASPQHSHLSGSSQSNLSSKEIIRRTAVAYDFLADGTCLRHESTASSTENESPQFHSPQPSNSLRVILLDTLRPELVKPRNLNDFSFPPYSKRLREFQDCVQCCGFGDVSPELSRRKRESWDTSQSQISNISPGAVPVEPSSSQSVFSNSSQQSGAFENDDYSFTSDKAENAMLAWETEQYRYKLETMDMYEVLRLLDPSSTSSELRISTHVVVKKKSEAGQKLDEYWRLIRRHFRNQIQLNGCRSVFYTFPVNVIYQWTSESTLEATFAFFNTSTDPDISQMLPLRLMFEGVILNRNSFLSLFSGDVSIGGRLLLLDLCAALSSDMSDFFNILQRTDIHEEYEWARNSPYQRILPGDRERVVVFARAARDLILAQDTIVDSIKEEDNFANAKSSLFTRKVSEQRARQKALENSAEDIVKDAERSLSDVERNSTEQQNASLKRLTIMAAVFLPASLSAAILSMTMRVRNLGPVLWDWLGIVVVILTFILFAYATAAVFWPYKVGPWDQVMARKLDRYIRGMRIRISKQLADENFNHDFPLALRVIYKSVPFIFLMAACACFLLGMFTNISEGAEALGYAAAGTCGYIVLTIMLWRLLKLFPRKDDASIKDILVWKFMEFFVRDKSEDGMFGSVVRKCVHGLAFVNRLFCRFFFGRKVVQENSYLKEDLKKRLNRALERFNLEEAGSETDAEKGQSPRPNRTVFPEDIRKYEAGDSSVQGNGESSTNGNVEGNE